MADASETAGRSQPPDPVAVANLPETVLRTFLDGDGRLITLPAKRAKRLLILDHVAQRFEPGERYPEAEVNHRLRALHDDVAMLRRYLIDEGFLDRAGGIYWRIGGTVDL